MTAAKTATCRTPGSIRKRALIWSCLLLGLALVPACLPLAEEPRPNTEMAEPAVSASDEAPLERTLVEQVQNHLGSLGYTPGTADGIAGARTTAAIEAYQQDRSLPVDGRISAGLLADLEAELARRAEAPAEARTPVKPPAHAPKPKPEGIASPAREVLPPPRYLPGARYLYANGDVQEVLAVAGDEVRWRNNRGETFLSNRNFILPPLSWSNGVSSRHNTLDNTPEAIWRQSAEGSASFKVITKSRDGGGPESLVETQEQWVCRQGEPAEVTVIAGSFDSYQVLCERLAADGTPLLERSWSYVPSLGHFVQRQDRALQSEVKDNDQPLILAPTLELVDIQPAYLGWPPAALGGLDRAMQHVLNALPAGEALDWRSSAVPGEITITAGERLTIEGQAHCRRLNQTWKYEGDTWRFPRLACRGPEGQWQFHDDAGRSFAQVLGPTKKQAAASD